MTIYHIIFTLIVIFVVLVLITALIHELYMTKWRKVFNYTSSAYTAIYFLNEQAEFEYASEIRNTLMQDFGLNYKQASDCITNWNNKEWFKQQEFLK